MKANTPEEIQLIDTVLDMVVQHCSYNGGFDSMALWANADAIRICAKYGLCTITQDDGGRILFAKIIQQDVE